MDSTREMMDQIAGRYLERGFVDLPFCLAAQYEIKLLGIVGMPWVGDLWSLQ
jgi:hypothetical protein